MCLRVVAPAGDSNLRERFGPTCSVVWVERSSMMQCRGEAGGRLGHQVGQELDEVLRAGGVGDPPGHAPLMDDEAGEEHGRAVAAVAVVAPDEDVGHRRHRGVDAALGLDLKLLVDPNRRRRFPGG